MKSPKVYRLGFWTLAALLLVLGLAAFIPPNVTIFNGNGVMTTYNSIPVVGNGFAVQYATVDLTAQAAAISATTLYSVPASGVGRYRVCFVAKATTAATVSSIIGGAAGFQILYTDPDDSVAVTSPLAALFNSTAAVLALNTTQAQYSGCMMINAKASTLIQYQMGYTSVGATPMAYNLHIMLESQ